MIRSEIESRPGPSFSGTQLRGTPSPSASVQGKTESNEATAIAPGPLNVEAAGLDQSTWNLNRSRRSDAKPLTSSSASAKTFGAPAGGSEVQSRSAGSWAPNCVPRLVERSK